MERAILERHLAEAEAHVSTGKINIERQGELVAKLERCGHNSAEARDQLIKFVDLQSMHVADRVRTEMELAGTPHAPEMP
jgi:hypothetical protein